MVYINQVACFTVAQRTVYSFKVFFDLPRVLNIVAGGFIVCGSDLSFHSYVSLNSNVIDCIFLFRSSGTWTLAREVNLIDKITTVI